MQKYLFIVTTLVTTPCALGSQAAPAKSNAEKIEKVEKDIISQQAWRENHPKLKAQSAFRILDEHLAIFYKLGNAQDEQSLKAQAKALMKFYEDVVAASGKHGFAFLAHAQNNFLKLERRKSKFYKAAYEESQAEIARLKALLPAQVAPPAYGAAPSGSGVIKRCTSPAASSK